MRTRRRQRGGGEINVSKDPLSNGLTITDITREILSALKKNQSDYANSLVDYLMSNNRTISDSIVAKYRDSEEPTQNNKFQQILRYNEQLWNKANAARKANAAKLLPPVIESSPINERPDSTASTVTITNSRPNSRESVASTISVAPFPSEPLPAPPVSPAPVTPAVKTVAPSVKAVAKNPTPQPSTYGGRVTGSKPTTQKPFSFNRPPKKGGARKTRRHRKSRRTRRSRSRKIVRPF
jgi:hypothetical protein